MYHHRVKFHTQSRYRPRSSYESSSSTVIIYITAKSYLSPLNPRHDLHNSHSYYTKRDTEEQGRFPLLLLSEDHAELRRVGAGRREDLPAAGLEVVGDRAEPGESDLVGGGGDGPELEDGDVGRPGDLDGAVHAGSFGGRARSSQRSGGLGLGLRFGRAFEPGEKTHGGASAGSFLCKI